jgi:hypothetical protein
MLPNGKIVKSGISLWQELLQSGLTPKTKSVRNGYDAALVVELRDSLFPGSIRQLEQELMDAQTTTEEFLAAFFQVMQPFSMMLVDILAMFEEANAKYSDNNLRIEFKFDNATPELATTLDAFREITKTVQKITKQTSLRHWNVNMLWQLNSIAEKCKNDLGISLNFTGKSSQIEAWNKQNGKRTWLKFPGFSNVSNHKLSSVVSECELLINAAIDACMEAGPTYDTLAPKLDWREFSDDGLPTVENTYKSLMKASHDYWANTFALNMEIIILYIESLPLDSRDEKSRKAYDILYDFLHSVPIIYKTIDEIESSFSSLINLPIWKRRHEVYAVWIGSRIMWSLASHCREWHIDEGVLRFPFLGAHLATIEASIGSVQFWTEMRTSLDGLLGVFGRKSIQPDFRLVSSPVHNSKSTILAVECKQFKRGVSSALNQSEDSHLA